MLDCVCVAVQTTYRCSPNLRFPHFHITSTASQNKFAYSLNPNTFALSLYPSTSFPHIHSRPKTSTPYTTHTHIHIHIFTPHTHTVHAATGEIVCKKGITAVETDPFGTHFPWSKMNAIPGPTSESKRDPNTPPPTPKGGFESAADRDARVMASVTRQMKGAVKDGDTTRHMATLTGKDGAHGKGDVHYSSPQRAGGSGGGEEKRTVTPARRARAQSTAANLRAPPKETSYKERQHELHPSQEAELQTMFAILDRDMDGRLDFDQLCTAIEAVGIKPTARIKAELKRRMPKWVAPQKNASTRRVPKVRAGARGNVVHTVYMYCTVVV